MHTVAPVYNYFCPQHTGGMVGYCRFIYLGLLLSPRLLLFYVVQFVFQWLYDERMCVTGVADCVIQPVFKRKYLTAPALSYIFFRCVQVFVLYVCLSLCLCVCERREGERERDGNKTIQMNIYLRITILCKHLVIVFCFSFFLYIFLLMARVSQCCLWAFGVYFTYHYTAPEPG